MLRLGPPGHARSARTPDLSRERIARRRELARHEVHNGTDARLRGQLGVDDDPEISRLRGGREAARRRDRQEDPQIGPLEHEDERTAAGETPRARGLADAARATEATAPLIRVS